VVDVEVSVEVRLVDVRLLDEKTVLGGDGEEGAKRRCSESRREGAVEVDALGRA